MVDYWVGEVSMAIHNLFLTFLSPVNNQEPKRLINEDVDDSIRDIITTNESALKYILYHTWKANLSFDKIFLICTDAVKTGKNGEQSAYDIFKSRMANFYKQQGQDVDALEHSLVPVSCGGNLDDIDLIKESIIDVSKRILEFKSSIDMTKDKICLYMDTTGGPRNAAMILLVISRMMAYHGIVVADMYYSSYRRVEHEPDQITVHRVLDIYNLFDIVAGFEEFKLFGSAKKLNAHFKPNEMDNSESDAISDKADNTSIIAIHELLSAMDSFSEAINISSRGSFETSIKRLDESLALVSDTTYKLSNNKDFEQDLVTLLKEPIEESYATLLEQHRKNTSDELAYIDWCLDHDYLQQALTLFYEYVPEYAVNKGIISCNQTEFYQYYKSQKENKKNIDKDIRALSMQLFNTINRKKGERLLSIIDKEKACIALNVSKEISRYIEKIDNEKRRIRIIEKDIVQQKERLNIFINTMTTKLIENCEKYLNEYRFTLYCQDENDTNQFSLLELIHFLKDILKDSSKIIRVNDILESLRKHIISEISKSNKYSEYITCDRDNGLLSMRQSSSFAYNTICNAILDVFLIKNENGKTDYKQGKYKNLICYKFPDLEEWHITYTKELISKYLHNKLEMPLFDIPGVFVPHVDEKSIIDTLEFMDQYFEIKKARNDTNHANKEAQCKYTTSKELRREIRKCVEQARQLSNK